MGGIINSKLLEFMPPDPIKMDILNRSLSRYTSLNFSYSDLSVQAEENLAKALETNDTITELNVSRQNSLLTREKRPSDVQFAKSIALVLDKNKHITHLNLEGRATGLEGILAIAKALRNNNTLTHLDLSDNNIPSEAAQILVEALKENKALRHLSLLCNEIDEKGAKALIELVEYNSTLTYLNLDANSIDVEHEKKLLIQLKAHTDWNKANFEKEQKAIVFDLLDPKGHGKPLLPDLINLILEYSQDPEDWYTKGFQKSKRAKVSESLNHNGQGPLNTHLIDLILEYEGLGSSKKCLPIPDRIKPDPIKPLKSLDIQAPKAVQSSLTDSNLPEEREATSSSFLSNFISKLITKFFNFLCKVRAFFTNLFPHESRKTKVPVSKPVPMSTISNNFNSSNNSKFCNKNSPTLSTSGLCDRSHRKNTI